MADVVRFALYAEIASDSAVFAYRYRAGFMAAQKGRAVDVGPGADSHVLRSDFLQGY
jgi:hypothetical protein